MITCWGHCPDQGRSGQFNSPSQFIHGCNAQQEAGSSLDHPSNAKQELPSAALMPFFIYLFLFYFIFFFVLRFLLMQQAKIIRSSFQCKEAKDAWCNRRPCETVSQHLWSCLTKFRLQPQSAKHAKTAGGYPFLAEFVSRIWRKNLFIPIVFSRHDNWTHISMTFPYLSRK